jgi:hypothetical protein
VLYPDGSFSTDVYTDKMMSYIEQRKSGKPFFAYLAYTAPHWPLQVPGIISSDIREDIIWAMILFG